MTVSFERTQELFEGIQLSKRPEKMEGGGLMARYNRARRSSLSLYSRPSSLPHKIKGLLHLEVLEPMAPQSSDEQTVSSVQQPIVDDDVPDTIKLVKTSARNVNQQKFERLPPLSRTVDNAFLDLFSRKIQLCCSKCDFSGSPVDNENRDIKKTTLNEFLTMYGELKFASHLPMDVHMQILSMCKSNIFRQIPIVNPEVLSSDHLPKFEDPEMQHISLCYKLLQKVIGVTEKGSVVTCDLAVQLMKLFNSPDIDEREYLANLVYMIYQSMPQSSADILTRVGILLVEYREKMIPPFCVIPSLIFLLRVFNSPTQAVVSRFFDVYNKGVLQLLSTPHLVSFFPHFSKLVTTVAASNARMASRTIELAIAQWPSTKPSKQECFVDIVTDLLLHVSRKEFSRMVKTIFQFYENCAHSTARVVEASFRVWQESGMRPKIMEHTKTIFPLVFNTYVAVSKTHWNSAIQTKALSVLKTMQSLDSKTYEDLIVRSTHLAPQPRTENNMQKKWALIARAAATADRSVNISQVLGEIQIHFNSSVLATSQSSVTRSSMTRSMPKVVVPLAHGASSPSWR